MLQRQFCDLMDPHVRQLRFYARSLCRNTDGANDLVQETLMRAWAAREQYMEGTNFKAWIFTILRNRFFDERRRAREVLSDIDTAADKYLATRPAQEEEIHFKEVARAVGRLKSHHRQVLTLVGAHGMTYEEAAVSLNCAVGTVRSRLSRARLELLKAVNTNIQVRKDNVASLTLEAA